MLEEGSSRIYLENAIRASTPWQKVRRHISWVGRYFASQHQITSTYIMFDTVLDVVIMGCFELRDSLRIPGHGPDSSRQLLNVVDVFGVRNLRDIAFIEIVRETHHAPTVQQERCRIVALQIHRQ